MGTIWLTKLLLSHFLTDFFLQPRSWITDRRKKKFGSGYLYLHTLITAAVACLIIGWQYWLIAVIIFVTHTIIDGWKSYMADKSIYFLADQALHLLVILGCWWFTFYDFAGLRSGWDTIRNDTDLWIIVTAFVFLTLPSSYLIGQLTQKWRNALANAEALANAGKWIGIIERCIMLALIMQNEYEAIGLLIAAKGFIRFNETARTEQKTEYLLIGTLISISIALVTGLIIKSV